VLERLSMTAEPGSTTIMVTRFFDAPPSAVFEAWTKAEHVAHWWDPSGAPLAVCEIDLRPGGAFRWVNQAAKGIEYSFTGTYHQITPPHVCRLGRSLREQAHRLSANLCTSIHRSDFLAQCIDRSRKYLEAPGRDCIPRTVSQAGVDLGNV
jgi:uncharacterized protein YndB with AHSA1/START domain